MFSAIFGLIALVSFFFLITSMNFLISVALLIIFIPSATLAVLGLDTVRDLW